jgi:hypothetical protein
VTTTPFASRATPAGRQRARVLVGAGAVGLLVAVVLVQADAPTVVRIVLGLPLLIGISGAALTAVLVPGQRRLDGLTRIGLVLLFGLTALVASALLVALVFRDGLPAGRLAVAQALLTAVPLVIVALRGVAAPAARPTVPGPTVWSGVAGVALLAVAFLLGSRIIPHGSAADVPTFSFTGPAATAAGPSTAAVGSDISLGWALRGAAGRAGDPTVQAVVDGQSVDVQTAATRSGSDAYTGTAVLRAPATPGLHRVVLAALVPARAEGAGGVPGDAGVSAAQRLELVTYVDVQAPGR